MTNSNKKDCIRVHGIDFLGLEEALIDFNEDNLNTIIDHVFALVANNSNMPEDEFKEYYIAIHKLLKKDYSFDIEGDNSVRFALTLVYFHRQNPKLHDDLTTYLQSFKNNDRDETIKKLEKRLGLTRKVLNKELSDEKNIDNLLALIAQNFKHSAVL